MQNRTSVIGVITGKQILSRSYPYTFAYVIVNMSCATLISRFFSINAGAVAFSRTSYSNKYRFQSNQEREELLRSPTADQADQYLRTHCIRDEDQQVYSYWQRMTTLPQCGIGLTLYLFSLKFFSLVFFLCGLIAIYSIKLNCEGRYFASQQQNWSGQLGMLGNVVGFETNTTQVLGDQALLDASDRYETLTQIQQEQVVIDGLYTILLMVSVVIYAIWTRKYIENNREKRPTLADFAIKLTHLPENKIMEMTKILEKCGFSVVEIVPIRQFIQLNNHLKRCKHRDKLEFLRGLKQKEKRFNEKSLKYSKQKLFEYAEKCKKCENATGGHSVIFVFERRFDRYLVQKMFHKSWWENMILKVKYWINSEENKHKNWLQEINAKIVPTPNDIYWENIRKKRYLKRYCYYTLSICLIVLCFGVVYGLKRAQTNTGEVDMESCMKENDNDVKYCNCMLNRDSDDESCSSQRARDVFLRVLTGAVIILVNSILPSLLSMISTKEKQSSMPRRKLSTMVKCFFGLAFNTSFVILLAYANFKEYKVSKALPMVNGDFKDVSRFWYPEVGFPILVSMLLGIIMPHLPYSLYYSFKKHCLRCVMSLFDTQIAYNYWVIGCDIDLPLKVAYQLTVILGCLMYAGGIPVMLLICAMTMLGMYMCERYLLRHYEMPSEHSTILNTWFIKLLPLAIFCHCVFSLYSLDAETIFPHLNPKSWYESQDYSHSFLLSATLINYTLPQSCPPFPFDLSLHLSNAMISNTTLRVNDQLVSNLAFTQANILRTVFLNYTTGTNTSNGCELPEFTAIQGGDMLSGHLLFNLETYLASVDNSYIARATHFSGVTFLVLGALSLILPLFTHFLETFMTNKDIKKTQIDLNSELIRNLSGGSSYQIASNPIYHDAVFGMMQRSDPVDEESLPLIVRESDSPVRLLSDVSNWGSKGSGREL